MPDDRGYVVVRPDGTVMWWTTGSDSSAAWSMARRNTLLHPPGQSTRKATQDWMERSGYTLRRCRLEEE